MRSFVQKVIFFCVINFTLINAVIFYFLKFHPEYFLVSYDDYYMMENSYSSIYKHVDKTNIIIGDSRGSATLIPKMLGIAYLNLSIPGSNFWEGYITVKRRLLNCKIDTLLLVYGFDFYESNVWTDRRTIPLRFVTKTQLFNLFKKEISNREIINEYDKKSIIDILKHQIVRLGLYYHFPISYMPAFKNSFLDYFNKRVSRCNIDSINKNSGFLNFGTLDSCNHICDYPYDRVFNINKTNLEYLDSIVALSKKNNFATFIIIPPVNHSSYQRLKNTTYLNSANYIFNSRKYCFINQINELPDKYFGDPSHLNYRGSVLYSKKVREILTSYSTANRKQ